MDGCRPGLLWSFLAIVVIGCIGFLLYPSVNYSDIGQDAALRFFGNQERKNNLPAGTNGNSKNSLVSDEFSTPAPADTASYTAFDQFSISPSDCSNSSPPFLLLIVFSRPNAFERRETIRRTYGSLALNNLNNSTACAAENAEAPLGVRLLFIVGLTDNVTQQSINKEAKSFGDVIQSSAFYDNYGQAARKGVSLIHWSLLHCADAAFTAKADDDCWINLPLLISNLQNNKAAASIYGLFWPNGAAVIRDPKNKWSVPVTEYPGQRYPPYVSGILMTFHKNTLAPIAKAVTELSYIFHDDVFLSGMAAQKAGIGHVTLTGYDPYGSSWNRGCSKKSQLAIHYVDDGKMKKLWADKCTDYKIPC